MRVLVLSDVHGNLEALRAVVERVKGWDEVLVLGDLVDYGPWPGEVIDYVRGLGARVVRGNHDHAVAYGFDCRCGPDIHWLSVWFRENVTKRLLSENDIKWLGSIPVKLSLEASGAKLVAVHGSPSNPLYGYLYPWLSPSELCKQLKPFSLGPANCPPNGLYLVGHTHHQFLLTISSTRILNPGSVGQPRDGVPKAAYAILNTETGAIEFGRISYDIDKVLKTLKQLGVQEVYYKALEYMLTRAEMPPASLKPSQDKAIPETSHTTNPLHLHENKHH